MKRIYNSGSFDKTNIYGEFTISLHKMITVNIPHAHLTHFNKNEKLSLQESQPFKNKEVSFLQWSRILCLQLLKQIALKWTKHNHIEKIALGLIIHNAKKLGEQIWVCRIKMSVTMLITQGIISVLYANLGSKGVKKKF